MENDTPEAEQASDSSISEGFENFHKYSTGWGIVNLIFWVALIVAMNFAPAVIPFVVAYKWAVIAPAIVAGVAALVKFFSERKDPNSFVSHFMRDLNKLAKSYGVVGILAGVLLACLVVPVVMVGHVLDVVSQPLKWSLVAGALRSAKLMADSPVHLLTAMFVIMPSAAIMGLANALALPFALLASRVLHHQLVSIWTENSAQQSEEMDRDLWNTSDSWVQDARKRKAYLLDLQKQKYDDAINHLVWHAPLLALYVLSVGNMYPKFLKNFLSKDMLIGVNADNSGNTGSRVYSRFKSSVFKFFQVQSKQRGVEFSNKIEDEREFHPQEDSAVPDLSPPTRHATKPANQSSANNVRGETDRTVNLPMNGGQELAERRHPPGNSSENDPTSSNS